MEGNTGPPHGGPAVTKNPGVTPGAFQEVGENPSVPENTSTPPHDTLMDENTGAPVQGLSHFYTPGDEQQLVGWDPLTTGDSTGEPWGMVDKPKPNTPPPRPPNEEEEVDLMQDIRTLVTESENHPKNEQLLQARQEQLQRTQKPARPESPTTRVSTGFGRPLPKLPGGENQTPPNNPPDTSTPMVTQEVAKSPGTREGTPHLVTPPARATPEKSPEQRTVSFADAAKGNAKPKNSPLQTTYCEIEEDEITERTPPTTDVTFSVWVDLTKVKRAHSEVKRMATKHPNIKGVGLRKESQWLECYCGSGKDVTTLTSNPAFIEDTKIEFIKARKILGDRLIIKLANVNPSPSIETTRKALFSALSSVVLHVEKVEPVYLKPEEDEPQEEWLISRRWNAIVYVPEGRRLVIIPHFDLFGTTIVMTWKGSNCAVCHHCKEGGHWTDDCNPSLRTLAAQKRQRKMQPAPIPTKTPAEEPAAEKPAEKGKEKAPQNETPETQPSKQPQPTKQQPTKPLTKTTDASTSKSISTMEKEAMEQSRQTFIKEGLITVISDSETPKKTPESMTPKNKNEGSKRKYKQGREVVTLTTTSVTTRSRTKGSQVEYALYLLTIGSMNKAKEATDFLNNVTPQQFIDVTKPGMSKQLYGNFAKFVDRRKNSTMEELIEELKSYKVSIPDRCIPGNPTFVDTRVAAKKEKTKGRKRKKVESTTSAESSTDERTTEAQPITRATIIYIDETGNKASFRIKFTQNMKINTLARSIMKKRKITNRFQLIRKSDNLPLDFTKTATEIGLKDGEELEINMEFIRGDPMEEEDEGIRIRILPKGQSKVWTAILPPSTSSTALYMKFGEHIGKKASEFTIYRSDGTPMCRYTDLGDLLIRQNEVLRQEDEELIPMELHWIDSFKQMQHRASYIPAKQYPKHADMFIRYEQGLEFDFDITTDEAIIREYDTMAELNEEMVSNRLFLKRPGQTTWEDREYEEEYATAEFVINTSENDEPIVIAVVDGFTILDALEIICNRKPEHAGKLILDTNNIQYDADNDLYMMILPGTHVLTHLSTANSYRKNEISKAIQQLASKLEITPAALASERFPKLTALP